MLLHLLQRKDSSPQPNTVWPKYKYVPRLINTVLNEAEKEKKIKEHNLYVVYLRLLKFS